MHKSRTDGDTDSAVLNETRRTVYVIDDDRQVRTSLHFLLASSGVDAWPFADCSDFIAQLPNLDAAPILVDVRMPEVDGFRMLEILKEQSVGWPVIIMTGHGDVATAVRAMKLGAIDFLEKPFPASLLDDVLSEAFRALDEMTVTTQAREDARYLIAQLSKRELEVVSILLGGATNKMVAQRLGLSARTVEMHRSNAIAKLGLKTVPEILSLITTAGLDPQSLAATTPRR